MKIKEDLVIEVVKEASARMSSDPNYTAVLVGGFVQEQKPAADYLTVHERELGGPENVVSAIFHCALIGLCFQRTNNRSVRRMSYEDLDHVAQGDREQKLGADQPALLQYIQTNIETAEMRKVVTLIALGMDWVS